MHALADQLQAPLGVVLEGGYNREILAECVAATLPVLAGENRPELHEPAPGARERELVADAVTLLSRYWPL
jgi:acetoin utilization deacetylase AcuC-like enzyme